MPDLTSPGTEDLKALRAELVTAFDNVAEPRDVFELQRKIADEISRSEPIYYADKSAPEKQHVQKLRIIGDSLAWRLLHPHTIRQLAKNQPAAISLTHQGVAFEQTMEAAEEQASKGIPAIVSDLTNCLRIADIVTCADPERPGLIECGGRNDNLSRGRKGRQMRRGMAIQQLLAKGEARLFGDDAVSRTVETDVAPEFSWSQVSECLGKAVEDGFAVVEAGPGDVIVAIHQAMTTEAVIDRMGTSTEDFARGMVGHHERKLSEPDPTVPPPLVWPLPLGARMELFENDLELVHFIDLDELCGPSSRGVELAVTGKGGELTKLEATVNGQSYEVSLRFVTDVLYGFQTIPSVRNAIDDFVIHINSTDLDSVPEVLGDEKTGVASIESRDDARKLLEDGASNEVGFVSLPLELFNELEAERQAKARSGDSDAPSDEAMPQ